MSVMGKKHREARPLSIRPLSHWHDACIEEIHNGNENWGVACLLMTHTGIRKRIGSHYTDKWREDGAGGEKISLPAGQYPCTLQEGGCCTCTHERYSGDDGYFMVKQGTSGQGRSIPVWDEWYDYHKGKSRPTELSKWLDHYFANHDSFGFGPDQLTTIVPKVASRREGVIISEHEGKKEISVTVGGEYGREEVPDIQPHDLRATWAQQCLRVGIDDDQLMDWAGWKGRDMIDKYRKGLDDPSGENRAAYGKGRASEVSPSEKIAKLQEMGLIDEDENLSAADLAELDDILS
jgi:hypothetical protein